MSEDTIIGTVRHTHRNENEETDSLEFGPAHCRAKIYFDGNDPEKANRKIANVFGVIDYANKTLEERGLSTKRAKE